jgi:DNA polymerase-1
MSGSASTLPAESPGRLLLVDGHAYAYRAFHAIRSLHSPSGRPTNAIYGFIKMLGRLRETLVPRFLAVVWDGGLSADRLEALPGYKAQRPPMPDALEEQIAGIQQYLEAAGLRSLEQEGIEADDWIATLAVRAARNGADVVIASSDKDFLQLVGPRIRLFNPAGRSEELWTEEEVRRKTGVGPVQIVDWLALIGDSVDNIAGVPGVGPKTATELLNRFGSVDSLYQRLNEVESERLRNALQGAEAVVRRNQQLIRLRADLPLEPRWDACSVAPATVERLRVLYSDWGFKSLLAALPSDRPQPQPMLL